MALEVRHDFFRGETTSWMRMKMKQADKTNRKTHHGAKPKHSDGCHCIACFLAVA